MKRFSISIILSLLCIMSMMAAPVLVKASLDSATLLMGRVTALHLELVQDRGTVGRFALDAVDTLSREVEIAARLDADTTYIGNGREQINRDIILQAFDSGMYVLPPVAYIVGADTITSQSPLTLKVIPVNVDSLETVHPLKPVAEPNSRWFDVLPVWLVKYRWIIVLALLLIAAVIAAMYFKRKHGTIIPRPVKKRLPADVEALQALQALKQRGLWQQGQDKAYFTELTDILRVYIDRRFGINAVEMTTTEIKRQLREHGESHAVESHLNMILEMADFVKFAAMRPLPADSEGAWQRAVDFVETTRPQPAPEGGTNA